MKLRLATRGSALALWQAEHVRTRLRAVHAVDVDLHIVSTAGDRDTTVPLSRFGGVGAFTKEIDDAVLRGDAHCAVHSLKDVPTQPPEGLAIAAIPERAQPLDAYVPGPGRPRTLDALDAGAHVGTSSLRRRALLLSSRPDLKIVDVRGNLDTRLSRLDDGVYDALILAAAGLQRLDRADRIGALLTPPDWLPAPGQGALAVVARADDSATLDLLRTLEHASTRAAVTAERALLRALEGGCQVPIGALATVDDDTLLLDAIVVATDGSVRVRGKEAGSANDAYRIGESLAARMVGDGANVILDQVRAAMTNTPAPGAP